MAAEVLIYGAYGYTGALITQEALRHGLRPILAGRNPDKLGRFAEGLDLETHVFGLEAPESLDRGLAGASVVIHCAGPFSRTARPMAEACLRTGTHYLDITGEIGVFEALARLDAKAARAGVMLLPGAGFDVVPSDCLAAHLKRALPSATRLSLAFLSSGRPSHGTALTMLENAASGGVIRRGGVLKPVPAAWQTRDIDFGKRIHTAVTIPWGDVSTAFFSTGIPDIEVYMAAPLGMRLSFHLMRHLGGLMGLGPVQRFLKARIKEGGPSEEARARGFSLLWGEVSDDAGQAAVSRLRTPDGYTLTAQTAVHIARRILHGEAPPGFKTPSLAYGPDLILEIEGVKRL